MVFKEPKVEFVTVDLNIDVITSSPGGQAGYETCTGPTAPSNQCPSYNTYWIDENGQEYYPS